MMTGCIVYKLPFDNLGKISFLLPNKHIKLVEEGKIFLHSDL